MNLTTFVANRELGGFCSHGSAMSVFRGGKEVEMCMFETRRSSERVEYAVRDLGSAVRATCGAVL